MTVGDLIKELQRLPIDADIQLRMTVYGEGSPSGNLRDISLVGGDNPYGTVELYAEE